MFSFRAALQTVLPLLLANAKAWQWDVQAANQSAKTVILDTDIFSDVDDVGALTVANVFHNCGLAKLAGVMVNTQSKWGALAASTINTYFGNGDIPIAAMRPLTNESFFDTYSYSLGEYASKLAYNFPRALNDSSDTPEPVSLYRQILSSAANDSITIISVGFFDNLSGLLNSTSDAVSDLSGSDLVRQKVRELVVMGGRYPSGWEFNFGGQTPLSTMHVVNNWPGAITYSGDSPGGQIYSGGGLSTRAPADSPILAAYQWYVGRGSTLRNSWDPVTVLYGILGLDGFASLGLRKVFEYANDFGYNQVMANGSNYWVNDTKVTNQHWLKLAEGVSNSSVAWVLDQLYVTNPVQTTCL